MIGRGEHLEQKCMWDQEETLNVGGTANLARQHPSPELGGTHWCIGLHSKAMGPARVRVIMLE
jgi:hypothetical protein